MKHLTRAIAAMMLVAVGTGAALTSPVSAAAPQTRDEAGGAAFITTHKTVQVLTEQPGLYTVYLVQTGSNGVEIVYTAVVEGGGNGSVPDSVAIQLRWTLCSHPAELTVLSHPLVGFDEESGEPIYGDPVISYTTSYWVGGSLVDETGNPLFKPTCGSSRN